METKDDGKKADWSTLHLDIFQMIMSLLIVKDNIRASKVCKAWYNAIALIQMKNRNLWLLQYPFSSRINKRSEFYDPSQDITYSSKIPEIVGMSVYYSKDGWLLMGKDRAFSKLLFFNPFTHQLINLPSCQYYNEYAIFTCAPTSDSCLVFGMANINNKKKIVAINTFKLGENEWKTTTVLSPELFFSYNCKLVFSCGLFYCLGRLGWLAVFDPSMRSWNAQHIKCSNPSTTIWFGTYLLEIKGDIFLLKTLGEKPQVFRLNRDGESWGWEEKVRFDEGLTVFGSFLASESRSNLVNHMKNKLLLSDSHHRMVHTYIFDEERYSISNSYTPVGEVNTIFQSVWIEPPKQLLKFI